MIIGDPKSPSFKVNKNDNYNTPVEAWEFLLNNMQQEAKNSIIWCTFYHDGTFIYVYMSICLYVYMFKIHLFLFPMCLFLRAL